MVWPMFALGEYINVSKWPMRRLTDPEVMVYKEVEHDPDRPVYPGGVQSLIVSLVLVSESGAGSAQRDPFSFAARKTLGIVGRSEAESPRSSSNCCTCTRYRNRAFSLRKPLEEWQTKSVREKSATCRRIMFVFRTVAENIAFGKTAPHLKISWAARSSDFERPAFCRRMETMAGERIACPAAKQRISIARVRSKNRRS